MFDNAAFFAANSIVPDYCVLTTSFTTYLKMPVSSGHMKSIGRIVNKAKTQTIAEAIIYNYQEKEIGRGNGIFVKRKTSV
jgi:acyl-CoA hydrolase